MANITKSRVSERVMQRVYLLWAWRKLSTSRMVRLGVLSFFVGLASINISFVDVFKNLRGIDWQVSSLANFFLTASLSTEVTVQIVGVLAAAITALFVADIGKTFGRLFQNATRSR